MNENDIECRPRYARVAARVGPVVAGVTAMLVIFGSIAFAILREYYIWTR